MKAEADNTWMRKKPIFPDFSNQSFFQRKESREQKKKKKENSRKSIKN